jgi:hypothetical protein
MRLSTEFRIQASLRESESNRGGGVVVVRGEGGWGVGWVGGVGEGGRLKHLTLYNLLQKL